MRYAHRYYCSQQMEAPRWNSNFEPHPSSAASFRKRCDEVLCRNPIRTVVASDRPHIKHSAIEKSCLFWSLGRGKNPLIWVDSNYGFQWALWLGFATRFTRIKYSLVNLWQAMLRVWIAQHTFSQTAMTHRQWLITIISQLNYYLSIKMTIAYQYLKLITITTHCKRKWK